MKTVQYIKEYGLENLIETFSLKASYHDSLPLVILNYDQINSSKMDDIVRECRGLIIELDTWNVIACPMKRFFNLGEALEITDNFDWNGFHSYSKEDGSLIHLWYYNNQWEISTRGSFGNGQCGYSNFTWKELITPLMLNFISTKNLNIDYTYVFEFCSPYNKIVRIYNEPKLYLLSIINKLTYEEFSGDKVDLTITGDCGIYRPTKYNFKSVGELKNWINLNSKNDPTFEGIVVTDKNGMKLKVKSATYLSLHKMRGEGDNMFQSKNLLPFIINGETDELLCYFPEVKSNVEKLQKEYDNLIITLNDYWVKCGHIENQKEFALAIKNCPYNWILFHCKKFKTNINEIIMNNQEKVIKQFKWGDL